MTGYVCISCLTYLGSAFQQKYFVNYGEWPYSFDKDEANLKIRLDTDLVGHFFEGKLPLISSKFRTKALNNKTIIFL